MGNKKIPYDEVVSGRVTARDKRLLEESGYGVREAVGFLLTHVTNSKKRLLIDKFILSEDIASLKKAIEDLNMDLIAAEMELEKINNELGIVELNGNEYSHEVNNAIDNIIQRYSKSSFDLDSYFQTNHLFVENQAAIVEMDVHELEDLVRKKVCKQN